MTDLILNRRAEITIDAFSSTDREIIQETIDQLKQYPGDISLYKKVKRVSVEDRLYVMSAEPDIRIILQIHDSAVEVLDIVRQDRLTKMFKH